MSKWRKFYPEANISIGTVDGQAYIPPPAAWGSAGEVRSGGRGGKTSQLMAFGSSSTSSAGRSQTGGYFALPAQTDNDEEEEEVSVALNETPFAVDASGLEAGTGRGILHGDELSAYSRRGAEGGEGGRSLEV